MTPERWRVRRRLFGEYSSYFMAGATYARKMYRRLPALLLAPALAFTACAEHALPADAVHDEARAIQIAKTICGEAALGTQWHWHARFQKGEWVAWFGAASRSDQAPLRIKLRASDGYAWSWSSSAYERPTESDCALTNSDP
jgi:hypothetical protein